MRTVFTVDPTTEIDPVLQTQRIQVKVERHPVNVPQMTAAQRLELAAPQLPDWSVANSVADRGAMLRVALRKHAGIAGVLDNLSQTSKGNISPIYVKLFEGDAELLSWEALCDVAGAFVALDRRWPIGRITDPATTQSRNEPRFGASVRIFAVISALGVVGQEKEWKHLRDAVANAWADGLDVRLRVLVGEKGLFNTISQEIANGLPWAEVAPVAGSGSRVTADIKRWQPNIVHFFCHGASEGGRQWLEFGTASDYTNPNANRSGSVTIEADQVVNLGVELDNPWLMTLNCCEGARPTDDLTSIAHQVVSTAFPAAIAMLEPVDADDAHELTRALYGSLFPELSKVADTLKKSSKAEFEWAYVMHEARVAINVRHKSNSASRKEWVVPALYVRGVDPMKFERPSVAESANDTTRFVTMAQTVAEWLVGVRGSMSADKRMEVMQEVLAGVPKQYWPDVDGILRG